MTDSPTTVLITGVGGPTPRAIARALKKCGQYGPYRIIGTDCDRLAIGLYQREYIDAASLVPRADDRRYWDAIGDVVARERVDVAVIQPEAEVEVWAARQTEPGLPCPALLPPNDAIRTLRDKALMHRALSGTGFVPKSLEIHQPYNEPGTAGERLGYPYWIRQIEGTSGLGSYRVEKKNDLVAWLRINHHVHAFLATQFLPGRNIGCQLLYYHGTLMRAVAAERIQYIMAKVAPSGITGNTAYGRVISDAASIVEFCSSCVTSLFARLGCEPHGMLTVDLKEDADGNPKVTEINVRHVAFTEVFALAGANVAEDTVQLAMGHIERMPQQVIHRYAAEYLFLRDVDAEPLLVREDELLGGGNAAV